MYRWEQKVFDLEEENLALREIIRAQAVELDKWELVLEAHTKHLQTGNYTLLGMEVQDIIRGGGV